MSALANPLWVAIRREGKEPADAALGDKDFCLAQIEAWGPADGRTFIAGLAMDLLDFFVNPNAPEAQSIRAVAAAFERASAGVERGSLDAPSWRGGGRRRDLAVLMCMAELAVSQGNLSAAQGERVQAEIAGLLRASERAH